MELREKIEGCIIGCAIGAEFGFSRIVQPEKYEVKRPEDISSVLLKRITDYKEERGRINWRKITPFIDIGFRTYIKKKARITPEDFAEELKNDEEISGPVFMWDGIHTSQEILKEGMNPRLSGLGNAPSGLICASMPAVGIYHFSYPEYAYLDGVEISAVSQPKLGSDWAGLCASLISSAFIPNITLENIVDNVLKIAFQNNKELFYQLNYQVRTARWSLKYRSEDEFLKWWFYEGGKNVYKKETNWTAFNPLYYVLPLIEKYAGNPEKLLKLLLIPGGEAVVSPVISLAVTGVLYGKDIFPKEWQKLADKICLKWLPIIDIVEKRVEREREIINLTTRLKEEKKDGESLLFDKIYGCILAGAIGNAMGSVVENEPYWEIDKKYPEGIRTVLDPSRLEGEDDNQMAALLFETYIERKGLPVMARHFGETWKKKLDRDHFYALCMGNSYDLIGSGWDPRITGHWNVVTGSTVMCMEPVGVYNIFDPEFSYIDAINISYMYQRGLDAIAAAVLAACVSEAFRPDATVESICKIALQYSPKNPLKTFDKRPFKSFYDYIEKCLEIADRYDDVFKVRKELYDKCLLYHMIDPLELFGFSLAILKVAKGDIRLSAIGGTNIGRDSDTISGRAAMLSGTLKGGSKVPEEWIKLFNPAVLERIKDNARKITEIIQDKKVVNLKLRNIK